MSTDLDRQHTLVNPHTGEALTLTSPTEDLARFIDAARRTKVEISAYIQLATGEILSRQDKAAQWTQHLPGVKVTGQSPAPVEDWNGAELREALLRLVDEGLISAEAVDAAVEAVVIYKPRKVGITALRRLGGRVAEVVDSLCREVERERRVSVTVTQ